MCPSRARLTIAVFLTWSLCGAAHADADYRLDYASGCQALRFWSWGRAAAWFRKALHERSQPLGTPVTGTGNNPLLYLPHYVLGVSLFGSGRYEEALHEWDTAEAEWQDLDGRTKAALRPYKTVIEQGREVYRRYVCNDVYQLARLTASPAGENGSASDARSADGAASARELCRQGSFWAAVRALASLRAAAGAAPRPTPEPSLLPLGGTDFENVPIAFSQEASDCEAPDHLHVPASDAGDSRAAAEPWTPPSPRQGVPGVHFASASSPGVGLYRSAALLTVPTISRGGPTSAEMVSKLKNAYARKVALLIAPEYPAKGPWRPLPDAKAALASLAASLKRWGFSYEVVAQNLRVTELEERIKTFIRTNAPKDSKARALVWVHFIGHVYTPPTHEADGWLVASDSPPVKQGDEGSYEAFQRHAYSLSDLSGFQDQRPHHVVVSLESCAIGWDFWFRLSAVDNLAGDSAVNYPAFILVSRGVPGEVVSASQLALTTGLADLLKGCGSNPEGVMTGYDLFTDLAARLRQEGIGSVQARKAFVPEAFRRGDMVLVAPAGCSAH
jgi:hypothetical protein